MSGDFSIIEGDVTLYDSAGVELAVEDATALPANTRGFIGVGYDGTNTRFIRVDSSGYQVIVGAGTAGSPSGGVVSVQGVSGGQAIPISAASLPLPTGAATEATLATLLTESTFTTRVPVLVTGGGTEATALRVTIASDSTGVLSVDDNGGSITTDTPQLPAALVGGRLDANLGAWLGATTPTVGQKAMAASIPVVVASDQSAIPASQSGTWTVQQGTPPWAVAGTDADGAAPTKNPVLTAGYDGTNVQTELTDTSGRQRVVGAAADGAAVTGDPVLVGGQDGTNAQSLLTDTAGRPRIVGAGAEDAAKVGDPVRVAGSDGTNTRDLLTDTGGRQVAVGAAADGATPVGNPVLLAGWDGTNVETVKTNSAGRVEEVLFDSSGNAVGVVLDGALYRLQADAKVAKGASSLVHLDAIDTVSGQGRLKATMYTPDGDPIAFPSVSSSIKNDFVMYSSSPDLRVDGSTTSVEFTYLADSTYDISLQEIKFTLVSNSVTFGSGYFGSTSGPLTNGLLVTATVNSGDTVTIYDLHQNESFVNFASPGGFEWVVSSKDMMSSNYVVGGGLKLVAGTGDKVSVLVRDDLSSCAVYFRCYVKGNLLTG